MDHDGDSGGRESHCEYDQARDRRPVVPEIPKGRIVSRIESLERDPTKWDRIGWSDVPRYKSEVFSNEDLKGSAAII